MSPPFEREEGRLGGMPPASGAGAPLGTGPAALGAGGGGRVGVCPPHPRDLPDLPDLRKVSAYVREVTEIPFSRRRSFRTIGGYGDVRTQT